MSLLFTETILTNTIEIDAPLAKVLAVMHEPERLARLNPLVFEIIVIAGEPAMYQIADRVPMLWGAVVVRYRARIVLCPDGVDSQVWTFPALRLDNRWRCEVAGERVRVHEVSTLRALRGLGSFVARTARTAHAELLANLKRQVELEDAKKRGNRRSPISPDEVLMLRDYRR